MTARLSLCKSCSKESAVEPPSSDAQPEEAALAPPDTTAAEEGCRPPGGGTKCCCCCALGACVFSASVEMAVVATTVEEGTAEAVWGDSVCSERRCCCRWCCCTSDMTEPSGMNPICGGWTEEATEDTVGPKSLQVEREESLRAPSLPWRKRSARLLSSDMEELRRLPSEDMDEFLLLNPESQEDMESVDARRLEDEPLSVDVTEGDMLMPKPPTLAPPNPEPTARFVSKKLGKISESINGTLKNKKSFTV